MHVDDIVTAVRSYRGVSRKAPISAVSDLLLPRTSGTVIASAGEDAAALALGEEVLLLAADGIVEDLIEKNPSWAGYCSVLVNVNDIAAMGGLPVAAVNVLACADARTRAKIATGMKCACDKFGVPMVGGHLHPDAKQTAVSVAMLGRTSRSRLVRSTTAQIGDSIVMAMDLEGQFTRGLPYSWDTTSRKSPAEVRRRVSAMNAVAQWVTAAKDISNPGALGTLGMLAEASGKGASVDIERIPRPMRVKHLQWLLAYQGCGFVVTANPRNVGQVMSVFEKSGLAAAECGSVTSTRRVEISFRGEARDLFDLRRDRLGCRPPQKI